MALFRAIAECMLFYRKQRTKKRKNQHKKPHKHLHKLNKSCNNHAQSVEIENVRSLPRN